MATDRIVFVPWNESQAGNFKLETEHAHANRGKTHHKRKWKGIYLDTPGKPLADVGMGVGVRIHIAGHGAIGDPEIAADHGTGGDDRSYVEVADLLIAKGFSKLYIGTVVCDVCYSALGTPPFAKLLARELYGRGHKMTCVMGYKGSLYATYGGKVGGVFKHRVVETDDGDLFKSSEMQERFFGW